MVVIHTTEGSNVPNSISDLEGLAGWFDNPASQASSHVGNDGDGNDSRMVPDEEKAWTCSGANPFTLNIEQIGFASTTRNDWYTKYPHQLANTARWIAYWSIKFGIPVRRGVAPFGVLVRSGVASHKQLGLSGGGHWDPGPAYPMRYVLLLARFFRLQETRHKGDADLEKARRKVNRIRRHYNLKEV